MDVSELLATTLPLSITSPRCAVGFSLHPIAIGSGLCTKFCALKTNRCSINLTAASITILHRDKADGRTTVPMEY